MERGPPESEAGFGDDTSEIWYQFHGHTSQPGRRVGADLSGRHGAGKPWRHGDGSGPAHEYCCYCSIRIGTEFRSNPAYADLDGQGAEHIRNCGFLRNGLEWGGGTERVRDAARADRAGGRRPAGEKVATPPCPVEIGVRRQLGLFAPHAEGSCDMVGCHTPGVLEPCQPFSNRFLPNTWDPLGSGGGSRQTIPLLCLWRCGERGG